MNSPYYRQCRPLGEIIKYNFKNMRKILVVIAIFCSLTGVGQEDFEIRLNDTLINVTLDKSYTIDVKGTKLKFMVRSKDTLTYTNSFYSFRHAKNFKASSS